MDREQLPFDAVFKGYKEVVMQDIIFRTENILFRREKYYSKSQQQTYLGKLPDGYHGQFGPGVQAWVLALYHEGGNRLAKDLGGLADGRPADLGR